MEFRPVQCTDNAYDGYVQLFRDCFPTATKYSQEYLNWQYSCNPSGSVVGFDAYDGERLAAHYVCIPGCAEVGGEEVSVLLSLNTATHPDYQGRGLFTKLAEATYVRGGELGYDCVYGVANVNSTPGFVRKLDFQLVGQLDARLGIGRIGIDLDQLRSPPQFRRVWSAATLDWRCSNPVNPIRSHSNTKRTTFLAPAGLGGFCAVSAELREGHGSTTRERLSAPVRLFIGLVPSVAQKSAVHVRIPVRLRPSPLNLIYRSLSGRVPTIRADSVFLNFLDFDAY